VCGAVKVLWNRFVYCVCRKGTVQLFNVVYFKGIVEPFCHSFVCCVGKVPWNPFVCGAVKVLYCMVKVLWNPFVCFVGKVLWNPFVCCLGKVLWSPFVCYIVKILCGTR
jgi:hypothetical protein